MRSGLCNYNLLIGSIKCPIENQPELIELSNSLWSDGWSIPWYDFSPDGKFIHLCYSSKSMLNYESGDPSYDGLVDLEGKNLINWLVPELEGYSEFKCSASKAIWRPLP
jgi:hypothetical protein